MYKRVDVEKTALEYFGDPLVANVWMDKYALKSGEGNYEELSPDDTIKRMAKEFSRIELKHKNSVSYDEIYNLMKGFNKFVLGGSPLFGIGNDYTLSTLGNCFVVDSPVDSIGGIWKTDQELAQIMKRRGGVGVDISTIRSRHTAVNNAAVSSTGVVPFMDKFSHTTRTIAQEGRRGALMISMDIDHPDAEEFICAKDDLTKITGANISVRLTDAFMKRLHDTHDITREHKLWGKLIHQAWKSAEPGVLFWDRILKNSPADCYPNFKTISTNPCSELPLCAYDSCRLGAINIYAYVVDPFTSTASFNFEEFNKDIRLAQRLMDDLIDLEEEKIIKIRSKITTDPESEDIKTVERNLWYQIHNKLITGRRTGLGLMGLADAGAALSMRYGSDMFIEFSELISQTIAGNSYYESMVLAKERGAFPLWNLETECENLYLKRVFELIKQEESINIVSGYWISWLEVNYPKYGRRNIANLTIAPTGSISLLAGVSSGIEPVFALSYTRRRKVSVDNPNKKYQDKQGDWWEEYKVLHPKYAFYLKGNERKLPDLESMGAFITSKDVDNYFDKHPYLGSTAHEIDPHTKLRLQSVIQPWIDHSISVTYNLPESTTEEQVSQLYLKAWKLGLKGLTVYRDGSRDGILTTGKRPTKLGRHDAPKRPKDLICDVHNIMAKGRPWKVFIGLLDEMPYEVFAVNGTIEKVPIDRGILRRVKSGRYDLISLTGETVVEDITHNMTQDEEAFTRIISWALRSGAPLEFGVEQLSKSEGDITSFHKAIARTFKKYCKEGSIRGTACPVCGTIMVSEGGCWVCKNCGNNKCD